MRFAPIPTIVGSTLLIWAASSSTSLAQYPGIQGAVERQILELEQKKAYAAELVQKGDLAISDKEMDYESAFAYYKSAVDILPLGGTASEDVRKQALDGFSKAAYLLAKQRVSEGRYEDAKLAIDAILEECYSPNDRRALSFRSQLADPKGFVDRGTLTPQHVARIEEVKRLLLEAKGFEASGRFDLAFRRCEQALNLDKHNIAARRMMEQINKSRSNYAKVAYDETRSAMLAEVSNAWELPVTKYTNGATTIVEQPIIATRDTQEVQDKLDDIIIPSVEFNEASLREALNNLRQRVIALDTLESNPAKKGVNIIVKSLPDSQEYPITFEGKNLPLGAVIDYIASSAGLKVKVDPIGVVLVPMTENTDQLFTREWKVSPNFFSFQPVSETKDTTRGIGSEKSSAKSILEEKGIEFPNGSSASYLKNSNRLIVTNTKPNLDSVDIMVQKYSSGRPIQVEIAAKFLEVTQNNLDELGFDVLLGQFALPGGSGIYGGGGTEGFGRTISGSSYPFLAPGTATPNSPDLPIGASSQSSGPITGGNRGGMGNRFGTAIKANAIDALLLGAGGVSGVTPGVLSVAGVFTNPEFQIVLRALSQKKGVDLISAPTITTRSGVDASIKMIQEFSYPVSFASPQANVAGGALYQPVAPSTPDEWDAKPVGITLNVNASVYPDNYTIDLKLIPEIIEFDGFINYGSPVFANVEYRSTLETPAGVISTSFPSRQILVTENAMNQPVFSERRINTQVKIFDGNTVVLGGLIREDIQKVEDKVPILGDIPLAGRLFRSNVDQHIKRNLSIFVTAKLKDPSGMPYIEDLPDIINVATSSDIENELGLPFEQSPLPQ